MSLNNIQIPTALAASLYHRHLIEEDPSINESSLITAANTNMNIGAVPKINKLLSTQIPLHFLGNNVQHFVMVVNYPTAVHLPEPILEFLGNILKACNLNLADVAIINCHSQTVTESNIKHLAPANLLFFGVQPKEIGIELEMIDFNITNMGGMSILKTPSLNDMQHDGKDARQLKANLWACLQQMLKL